MLFSLVFLVPQAAWALPGLREQDVLDLVRNEACARLQIPRRDVDVAWKDMALDSLVTALPPGRVSLQLGPVTRLGGARNLPVQVLVNGQKYRTIFPRLDVQITQDVLVTVNRIPRGSVPQSSDFELVRQPVAHMAQPALTSWSQVVGNETTRDILPGTVLTSGMFRQAPLVKAGDEVTVVVQSGGLSILSRGIARSAGGSGNLVKIVHPDTKHEFVARVTAPGKVEVRLEEP
ncbi:MAG: flagellar basal body P-ring formation chaperone FlgA [Candidatus Sericytochromatia bacterium]|nr:flagellar basal body P-ring formation chaperone FlgA [Candidatus Sericytochromatia bacterium]